MVVLTWRGGQTVLVRRHMLLSEQTDRFQLDGQSVCGAARSAQLQMGDETEAGEGTER